MIYFPPGTATGVAVGVAGKGVGAGPQAERIMSRNVSDAMQFEIDFMEFSRLDNYTFHFNPNYDSLSLEIIGANDPLTALVIKFH
jgi:hypothetical protein